MLIAFLCLLVVSAALYFLSIKGYKEAIDEAAGDKNKLALLLPVGFLLLEHFKKGYSTFYDRKLLAAVGEVHGVQHALGRLKRHWACKIAYTYLALLFCLLLGVFTRPDWGFAVFCAVMLAAAAVLPDRELFSRVNKRRFALQRDFPDFVNRLVLLINAGMTVQKAWEKASSGSGRDTPLYRELGLTLQDIKAGKSEYKAYEEFAKRCRTAEITRFISVILQNLRKGNSELVPILRMFSVECWEMRKNIAKRYGEEASTKMLLPMMLMFVAILLIVGVPAVLSLRNLG